MTVPKRGERLLKDASYTIELDIESGLTLSRLAEERAITVEKLLQNMLRSYLAWKLVSAKAEFSPVPKSLLKALLENMSDEQLKELALKAADDFRDIVIQTCGGIDLEVILALTDERARRSGFIFRQFDDDNIHTSKSLSNGGHTPFKTIFMEHDMGIKWSVFFKIHMEALLKNSGYSFKNEYTDSWWSMQIWQSRSC